MTDSVKSVAPNIYKPEDFPSISLMKWAMLVSLLESGEKGEAANSLDEKVAKLLNVPTDMFHFEIKPGKRYMSYRLGWERTRAKKLGYIEKIPNKPKLWRLTPKGMEIARRKRRTLETL